LAFALPHIIKDLNAGIIPQELSVVLSKASWFTASELSHLHRTFLLTFCNLEPTYVYKNTNERDIVAVILGLIKFRYLREACKLIDEYSSLLSDKELVELQFLKSLLSARQADPETGLDAFKYIEMDDPNKHNKLVSFALACVPSRPCLGFNMSIDFASKIDLTNLRGSDLYGIQLIQCLHYEDLGLYDHCLELLAKLVSDFQSSQFAYHNGYVAYHIIRIQNRMHPTLSNSTLPYLVPLSSVNEPGIVCGIASQLAFSFTDKRPETALHYLKISNSLYAAHLSNEKTSFATLNRRIELILRDALGDDYIDAHLTSVDASNVSIGDLCGPLDEYVRQTTLFAQG
jgi:hypothetical protein